MANRHVYFGIENLGLTSGQKLVLLTALDSLGQGDGNQPAELNHSRTRLDNEARIYEALFDEVAISIQAFKNRLGAIFGVDPSLILHSIQNVVFVNLTTAVVTFQYPLVANERIRVNIFGYDGLVWPSWRESAIETRRYLFENAVAWGEEVEP